VGVVGFGGAPAEGRVKLAGPLADPRHDLKRAGQQRGQAPGIPAVRRAALLDQGDQGGGLLLVVPADEQGLLVAVGAVLARLLLEAGADIPCRSP
jgi:hypothetical protein